MQRLMEMSLAGFKSIEGCENLGLGSMNVMIGANGAGKSNFISFLRMLNHAMEGGLGEFVGQAGGASSLLHFGPKKTPGIRATLRFHGEDGVTTYRVRWVHGARDSLVFGEESIAFDPSGTASPVAPRVLGAGHRESALLDDDWQADPVARRVRATLGGCRVHQFHDTSATAPIRNRVNLSSNRCLMPDGGNLAAVLALMAERSKEHYRRIVSTIRLFAPFFWDFSLQPLRDNPGQVLLNWRAKGSEHEFGPHQLSDGTLRMMALTTLLLQPPEDLPSILIIDEPELGLHPHAIIQVGAMLASASTERQVIVATQSVQLLNQFAPADVVVVEQTHGVTRLRRLEEPGLREWLAEYSLGDLWEKNVIGGRPG